MREGRTCLHKKSNNPNLKGGEQWENQKTRERIAATERHWRLPSSPIVEKNMCIFYVVVVAVVVVVVVAVDMSENNAEDMSEDDAEDVSEGM